MSVRDSVIRLLKEFGLIDPLYKEQTYFCGGPFELPKVERRFGEGNHHDFLIKPFSVPALGAKDEVEDYIPLPITRNTATGKLEIRVDDSFRKQQKETLVRRYLKFLPDAQAAQGRSKDRSTQVGAVVIDDDFNLRSSGYNGFARGVNDDVDSRHERPTKYFWAAHAEENAVAQAARVGVSLKGCTILLTSLFPCSACARMIIQSGIKRVIAPRVPDNDRWDEQGKVAMEMLGEAGVEVLYYDEPTQGEQ